MSAPKLYITYDEKPCRADIKSDWETATKDADIGDVVCDGKKVTDIYRGTDATYIQGGVAQDPVPEIRIAGTTLEPARTPVVKLEGSGTGLKANIFTSVNDYLNSMRKEEDAGYEARFGWYIGGKMAVMPKPAWSGDNLGGEFLLGINLPLPKVIASMEAELEGGVNPVQRPADDPAPLVLLTNRDPVKLPEDIALRSDRFVLKAGTTFKKGESTLLDPDPSKGLIGGAKVIENAAIDLKNHYGDVPTIVLKLAGTTDLKNDHDYNLKLAKERAKVVADEFAKQDIKAAILYGGLGETLPTIEEVSTRGRFIPKITLTGRTRRMNIPDNYEPEATGYWYYVKNTAKPNEIYKANRARINSYYRDGYTVGRGRRKKTYAITHAAFFIKDKDDNYLLDGSRKKRVFVMNLEANRTVYAVHHVAHAIDGKIQKGDFDGIIETNALKALPEYQSLPDRPQKLEDNPTAKQLYALVQRKTGRIGSIDASTEITAYHLPIERAEILNIAKGTTENAQAYQLVIRKMVGEAAKEAFSTNGHLIFHMNQIPSDTAKEIGETARTWIKDDDLRKGLLTRRSDDIRKKPSFVVVVVKGK